MKSTYASVSANAGAETPSRAVKYVSFRLVKEDFAIEASRVREIMGMQDITAVTHPEPYVKGLINLRGKVIPVIDLRMKFGLALTEFTNRTCIIVVQLDNEAGKLLMGAIVDGVSEVLNLQPSEIHEGSDSAEGPVVPYLLGTTKIKGKTKTLIDINKVLSADEMRSLESVLR
jgi:purine-binding chemotaxis protein CheW